MSATHGNSILVSDLRWYLRNFGAGRTQTQPTACLCKLLLIISIAVAGDTLFRLAIVTNEITPPITTHRLILNV